MSPSQRQLQPSPKSGSSASRQTDSQATPTDQKTPTASQPTSSPAKSQQKPPSVRPRRPSTNSSQRKQSATLSPASLIRAALSPSSASSNRSASKERSLLAAPKKRKSGSRSSGSRVSLMSSDGVSLHTAILHETPPSRRGSVDTSASGFLSPLTHDCDPFLPSRPVRLFSSPYRVTLSSVAPIEISTGAGERGSFDDLLMKTYDLEVELARLSSIIEELRTKIIIYQGDKENL